MPSAMSVVICLSLSLAIVTALVVGTVTKSSLYRHYFPDLTGQHVAFYDNYQHVQHAINSSSFLGNASVFMVWAMIGLVIYYIVVGIVTAATGTRHFLEHLSYSHTDKVAEWRNALAGLLIRLVVLVIFFSFVHFYLRDITARVVALATTSVQLSLVSVMSFIAAFAICFVLFHGVVVLARLFLLRTRVFYTKYSYKYD